CYRDWSSDVCSSDLPHVWVQVDLTKPVVFLSGVRQSNGTRTLDLTWTARDDNFGRKPINLSYSENSNGPWSPIAPPMEKTGAYKIGRASCREKGESA